MGDSSAGSHSWPQLMTHAPMAAELPKLQRKAPWEAATTAAAALGAKTGSLGEPSATREQRWHQPRPPWSRGMHPPASHPIMATCPVPMPPPVCAAGTCFVGSITKLISSQLLLT